MLVVDWIVESLIEQGVTDVFGIPGAVVLDFLYALDRRRDEIRPHLAFHEQGGAFSAVGYAQTSGTLGVAYSTRGPGFTNMITAIADAYYDSIPTLFITAHSSLDDSFQMRTMNNQEIDTVSLVKEITKMAVRIDHIEDVVSAFSLAFQEALSGRKGPVFIDVYSGIFNKELDFNCIDIKKTYQEQGYFDDTAQIISEIEKQINQSKRPILLIGNGTRGCERQITEIAHKFRIPVVSSRVGQDIVPGSEYYYGYIGSRGMRFSNFILGKTDLIVSIGNRMAFPKGSKSFNPIVEGTRTIRIDIDKNEFARNIPNCFCFCAKAEDVMEKLYYADIHYENDYNWRKTCDVLKEKLDYWDENETILTVSKLLKGITSDVNLVCDVGNHSFWVSIAYSYAKVTNRIMYSGAFGTLGSALPKAIGSFYSTKKPVVCFAGDQGIQLNIQELQYIADNQIPIMIVILNNSSSGMIMERENAKFGDYYVHTTTEDGYSHPCYEKIAGSYGLKYIAVNGEGFDIDFDRPSIQEIMIDPNEKLNPYLPIGKICYDLSPNIPRTLFEELSAL